MLPDHRARFNRDFTPAKYQTFLDTIDQRAGTHVKFRLSETPVFFPRPLLEKMARYGQELTTQLLQNPAYLEASTREIPERFRVPNEVPYPHFLQADFGIDTEGEPKLVEIQGFPSLYAFQPALAQAYRDAYSLNPALHAEFLPNYLDLFRHAVIANHDPAEVFLTEIDPLQQKTLPDFLLTAKLLGVKTISITDVVKRGNRLYYGDIPVRRIYNRAIVDEMERKGIQPSFDFRDDLDVEWAGHPNWYFRISKFSIPYLNHPSVPETYFLHQLKTIPGDLDNWVLKPLYSFAGLGVVIGPTREQVEAADPMHYILQRKVNFAPTVNTPEGPTKAEVRIMYIWTDHLQPVTTIIRMGRGKMMGVDHNRDMEWVGASAGFFE